jgi:predicted O-methyltransferase YrrM
LSGGGSERKRHLIALAVAARRISKRRAFDPPLNGQQLRLRTVEALIRFFSPDAVIETGTFLGDSTRFFADQGLPVYSIEVKRSFHWLARLRFATNTAVRLIRADSRTGLAELARQHPFERTLAYLDAHLVDRVTFG